MYNSLEAMTKQELLDRRQQDEMPMAELDTEKEGNSCCPGIWHSTQRFEIFE